MRTVILVSEGQCSLNLVYFVLIVRICSSPLDDFKISQCS